MHNKAHINITVDSTVLNWIDRLRGQKPRSRFINHILNRFCERETEVFDWVAEDKKAAADIEKGRVHKFTDAKKATQWLKS